jgi:hypothetical protein
MAVTTGNFPPAQQYFVTLSCVPAFVRSVAHDLCRVPCLSVEEVLMKKSVLAIAVAGLALASASGAHAQSATQTLTLTASVNALCTIGGSATGVSGDGGAVVTTGTNASAQTLSLTSGGTYTVACSAPNTVTITSANDGIKSTTPGAGTNIIDYTATVAQGITTTALATSSGAVPGHTLVGTNSTPAPFNGPMTITVATAAATNLTPGFFTDTLTVTVVPH